MIDLRWFAPNQYCGLLVPHLRAAGLNIATEGDHPAALVVAMDGKVAVDGFEFASRHGCPLLLYLWDLPPWRLGVGRPDVVFSWRGRVRRVPRFVGGYRERPGHYSRVRFVARRADWVWAPSTSTATDLRKRFGVEARVEPFCYDSHRFRRIEWVPTVPPRLLSVSRLVPHKNHAALIRAAAQLQPRPMVQLIGRGGEAESLRALADRLGVALMLETEWQSDAAVAAAYRAATVVVAPSRFEGFGLTPIEAVATGIPTVASDIPPHREHLGDAVTYFNLEDDRSLAGAIRTAIDRGPPDTDAIANVTCPAAADRFGARLVRLIEGGVRRG